MDALGEAFTDVVLVITTTALGHFGVEVNGLEPTATRERPAVHRTVPAARPQGQASVSVKRRAPTR